MFDFGTLFLYCFRLKSGVLFALHVLYFIGVYACAYSQARGLVDWGQFSYVYFSVAARVCGLFYGFF